ncbi:MAG: regulatory protein RecX [bacterium]
MAGRGQFRRRDLPPVAPDEEQPDPLAEGVRLLAVREQDRSVVLCLDDGRVLEVAPASLPQGLPPVGEAVPAGVLRELQAAADRKAAARDLLAMIGRRLQPTARLREKLLEKGHSPEAVSAVLEEMEAQGLCSDRIYAEAYCRDCLRTRQVGRRYLENKLRQKRVPFAVAAAAAADSLSGAEELEMARSAARSQWRKLRGPADRRAEARVQRFLLGRGFDPGTAARALRETRDFLRNPAENDERDGDEDPGDGS